MNLPMPHAVIVDPFSSGRFLVEEFQRRGIPSVAVLTHGVPAFCAAAFRPEAYAAVIDAGDTFDVLADRLRVFAPCSVMTGVETGIALMDRLAVRFGLRGNDPLGSDLRRDKYLMQEAIRSQGLPAAAQCRVDHAAAAAAWLQQHGRYPVVVKPAASAGSDNFNLCHTQEEALAAVQRVLGADSLFGMPNTCAVLQEYLEGEEWAIDAVCCDGEVLVTNVTSYRKELNDQGRRVYRHSTFAAPDAALHGPQLDYAQAVLGAIGLRYGAAHTELIVTAHGPMLVEVNGRMHGGDVVSVLRDYAPYTQLELAVDAQIDPEAFRRKRALPLVYRAHLMAHFLISRAAGRVRHVIDDATLHRLPCYVGGHLPEVGSTLCVTDSLTTAPGYIWLAGSSGGELERDQNTLIALERAGALYS